MAMLSNAVDSLKQFVCASLGVDNGALDEFLLRCEDACHEVEHELPVCSS